MLDRRRILAAALAVVAYPAGVVFAQPGLFFRQCRRLVERSGRVARADPAPSIGHEVAGGEMADAGFGCPGVGGAEWSAAFRLGRADWLGARAASRG